jgi:hypothetical protein
VNETLYEIVETRYNPQVRTKLDFKGGFEETKAKANELARKNIGTRYAVFRTDSFVAEYQAFFSRTVTCPKCGEVIPIE